AKPFEGHSAIIQRNALKSWKLLHPEVEVILFGDEEGSAEVCAEYGLRHEPHVERFESRMPYMDFLFGRAQEIARHEYVCYSNCDIVLTGDFWSAFESTVAWSKRFLLISRRWDVDIKEPVDFRRADWARELREYAVMNGVQQNELFIDFFLFPRGIYADMPRFIVGYCYWDNWAVWRALSAGVPVIDASSITVPVHQNHEYTTTPERFKGSYLEPNSMRNFQIAGGFRHLRNIGDATHLLTRQGMEGNARRYWMAAKHASAEMRHILLYKVWFPVWFPLLNASRPLRTALGLRRKSAGHRE
ncbi:MAG TPA: hypothetical protein VGI46_15905, partial [Candidatus Acidoferrum sp.]